MQLPLIIKIQGISVSIFMFVVTRPNNRYIDILWVSLNDIKQPPWGVPREICSENMQQIYRGTPMPKLPMQSNFIWNRISACSPTNLLHIFRTPFPKNTSDGLLIFVMMSFNDTRKENFFTQFGTRTEIEAWLLLTFFLC